MIFVILVADIGNTNITLGVYRDHKPVCISRLATQRHRTSEQYAIELDAIFKLEGLDNNFNGAIISSVVPELTRVFKDAIKKVIGCDALVVAAGIKNGLKITTDNPKELGADLVDMLDINIYDDKDSLIMH
jgi:type III pantothenate kinase